MAIEQNSKVGKKMFGGKQNPVFADQEARNGQYVRSYEYRTISALGVSNFDKIVNEDAEKGWELVNGCMAGTAHYGYMRRALPVAR